MGVKIEWTSRATSELTLIWEYIAKDSPSRATHVAQRIVDAIDGLERFPSMGWMVPEGKRTHLRELIVFNYRIVYRVGAERLHAIFHGARQFPEDNLGK